MVLTYIPKNICKKVNVITLLEFYPVYNDAQHVSHCAAGTPPCVCVTEEGGREIRISCRV